MNYSPKSNLTARDVGDYELLARKKSTVSPAGRFIANSIKGIDFKHLF